MSRKEKIQKMVRNYIQAKDRSDTISIMEFHRKQLLRFSNRFYKFAAHYQTPSSALLSHDIFLVVEAATIVAKTDWANNGEFDAECSVSFSRYFDAFDKLALEPGPLDKAAALCIDALSINNHL